MSRLSRLLLSAGSVLFFLAVIWWWETYREVIAFGYISTKEAGLCLLGDTDICTLARVLCRNSHPFSLIDYPPAILWLATLAVSAALLIPGRPQRIGVGLRRR